jgi:hypothetical protein
VVIRNPNRIKLGSSAQAALDNFKKFGFKPHYFTESNTIQITWNGDKSDMLCIKKEGNKYTIFKGEGQTEPNQVKTKLTDYLKSAQYVETIKGWVKGFVLVYLDKKTWRIKHTINKTKGSKLYAKTYKDTIKYFESIQT